MLLHFPAVPHCLLTRRPLWPPPAPTTAPAQAARGPGTEDRAALTHVAHGGRLLGLRGSDHPRLVPDVLVLGNGNGGHLHFVHLVGFRLGAGRQRLFFRMKRTRKRTRSGGFSKNALCRENGNGAAGLAGGSRSQRVGPRRRDSDAAEQGRPGGGPNAEARQPGLRGPHVPRSREQPGQPEAPSQAPAPG